MKVDRIRNVHLRRLALVLVVIFALPIAILWEAAVDALAECQYAVVTTRTMWSRDYRGNW